MPHHCFRLILKGAKALLLVIGIQLFLDIYPNAQRILHCFYNLSSVVQNLITMNINAQKIRLIHKRRIGQGSLCCRRAKAMAPWQAYSCLVPPSPARLADGFGLEDTLLHCKFTPKIGPPAVIMTFGTLYYILFALIIALFLALSTIFLCFLCGVDRILILRQQISGGIPTFSSWFIHSFDISSLFFCKMQIVLRK